MSTDHLIGTEHLDEASTDSTRVAALFPDLVARLVAVRVGGHTVFDRVVFDFAEQRPGFDVGYVDQIVNDATGEPVSLRGRAALQIAMNPADAHDETGTSTIDPLPSVSGLAALRDLVVAGDFEAHVTIGVGVADRLPFSVFDLTGPTRIVVDVRHAPPGTGKILLRRGDRGAAVATWQWRLNLARSVGLVVDEAFGTATEAATRAFQSARGLEVDGIVGPLTRRAMEQALGL
jgi:hypothetical protein